MVPMATNDNITDNEAREAREAIDARKARQFNSGV